MNEKSVRIYLFLERKPNRNLEIAEMFGHCEVRARRIINREEIGEMADSSGLLRRPWFWLAAGLSVLVAAARLEAESKLNRIEGLLRTPRGPAERGVGAGQVTEPDTGKRRKGGTMSAGVLEPERNAELRQPLSVL